MFDTPIEIALAESAGEVLEKMFFVEPPEISDDATGVFEGVGAQVIFDGDPPGCFDLRLDIAAAQTIAANFLGLDAEELTQTDIEQVVGELANMICGAALSRIESAAVFRLASPEVTFDPPPSSTPPGHTAFCGKVGGGQLHAELRMERPVCLEFDELAY